MVVGRVKTTKKKTHATKKMGSHNRVTHVDKVARTFYDSTGSLYHILPPFFFIVVDDFFYLCLTIHLIQNICSNMSHCKLCLNFI
jgi:hypothetical protein